MGIIHHYYNYNYFNTIKMASFQSSDMIAWIYFTKDTPKMAFITSTRMVPAS